jgi:predicted outer membrane repeat protein
MKATSSSRGRLAALYLLGLTTLHAAGSPDYSVTISGTTLTVTDETGSSDTLGVSEPNAGTIRFAAMGRTFSVNGGPLITGDSGIVPLSGVATITVNAGAGGDTINVGAFSGFAFPNLTLNGGTGDDTVNFTGDINFASSRLLNVDLQDDDALPGVDSVALDVGANLVTRGGAGIVVKCSRSVSLRAGASLVASNGNLRVEANWQAAPTSGNFIGVSLDGAGTRLSSGGDGDAVVLGRGGDDPGGAQVGVQVTGGAKITGGGDLGGCDLDVYGTGGASTGGGNCGIVVSEAGSAISAGAAAATIVGAAGALGSADGIGVAVLNGGEISTEEWVEGTGGGAAGSGRNHGVALIGAGSRITARPYPGGPVPVGCTAGPGAPAGTDGSWALFMANSAAITSPGGVYVTAGSIALDNTVSIASTYAVEFASPGSIDLGGADASGLLGLSDAELDRVTTPQLSVISASETMISAPITRPVSTGFRTYGKVRAVVSGTDLALGSGEFVLSGPLAMPVTSVTADTGYPRLTVSGGVNLNGQSLDLTGTTFPGVPGDTFTVVENDGADAIAGTFSGLSEGATFPWPGSPGLRARISYVGGTGNDVVLTLLTLEVTNTADSGPGSLRAALATAATTPGADVIGFSRSAVFRIDSVFTPTNTEYLAVRFSRAVDPISATNVANYLLSPPTVVGATMDPDGQTALLILNFPLHASNTLTVQNVTALNGESLAPNPTTMTFRYGAQATNIVPARIFLASEIAIADATGPVTIDATGFPGGVTVDGGAGTNRLFSVAAGSTLNLIGLAVTGGHGAGALDNGSGGAICNRGTLQATDCAFFGNSAVENGGAIFGGGTLTRCDFTANNAREGGAVAGFSVAASECRFTGNASPIPSSGGGAISLNGGISTFQRCTFSGNSAAGGGGALLCVRGTTTLTQCTLSGNTSSQSGGAIFATVVGTTDPMAVTVRHCTITGNTSETIGGGIARVGGSLRVENSIVAGNVSATGGRDFYGPGAVNGGRNVIGTNTTVTGAFPAGAPNANGDYVGTDANPMDPLLAPLGDYGGFTATHALLSGSPARDHSAASAVTSDQRGFPIVGVADIGAYEAGTFTNYALWAWETLPAATPLGDRAPGIDLDLDARSNALEFATLTDGGTPSATSLLNPTLNAAGTEASLTLPYRAGIAGLRYFIDRSTALANWIPIVAVNSATDSVTYLAAGVTLVSSDPASLTFTDATIAGQRKVFYRLRFELDP